MSLLPPELMSTEQRVARAEELRRESTRQWLLFAIAEAVVIFLPFGIFMVLYVTGVLPESALVPGVLVAIAASVLFTLYWVFGRIQPRMKELAGLD
jgi:membrane protein YdbS with pleckstrin-like domain